MPRNQAVELIRLFAAFCVVTFHSGSPFFAGGAGALAVITLSFESSRREMAGMGSLDLARRILVPFGIWLAIYAAIPLARGHSLNVGDDLLTWVLAGGEAIHLWYLPFIFAVILAFRYVRPRVSADTIFCGAAAIAALLLILVPFWRPAAVEAGAPVAQWFAAAPAVFAGITVGAGRQHRLGAAASAGLALIATCVIIEGFAPVGVPVAVAVPLLAVALHWGRRLPKWFNVQFLADQTMGIYLIHPLALWALWKPLHEEGLLYGAAAFVLSLAMMVVYRLAMLAGRNRRSPSAFHRQAGAAPQTW